MGKTLLNFFTDSGFGHLAPGNLVMIGIGLLFIVLAIKKGFEPLLLVPIGFGILIGNIPYNSQKLALSVYDGPVSETKLEFFLGEGQTFTYEGKVFTEFDALRTHHSAEAERVPFSVAMDLVHDKKAFMVDAERYLVYRTKGRGVTAPAIVEMPTGGNKVFIPDLREDPKEENYQRYNVVVPPEMQDPWNASVMWMIFRGIEWGIFPPLIFLGIGALTDFSPLLANPKLIILGAAAQLGIFGALMLALVLGFDMYEAASIGIIGGADGPTAIFTCTKLAPHLLGAVALAAYSYMAMVPIIQPPIMRLLTTKEERLIRMGAPKEVAKTTKIIFPLVGFILTAFIANGGLALLGMLFFGNLLRECTVTDRLAKTAQTTLIDIVTILLGLSVGAKTQASNFLTTQTIKIFILGVVAFSIATAAGLLFAKAMNLVSKNKINPLVGAAGVSAVPMAARVVQVVAHKEDKQNFLLMHAMGPNVAGVIGSAVAAGVLLSHLAK